MKTNSTSGSVNGTDNPRFKQAYLPIRYSAIGFTLKIPVMNSRVYEYFLAAITR